MAESTLSKGSPEYDKFLGLHANWPMDSSLWTANQTTIMAQAKDGGYTRFLTSRRWTFLEKSATITTAAADYTYDLPDDFGTLLDRFNFPADTGYSPPRQIGLAEFNHRKALSDVTGPPTCFALRNKAYTGAIGQRQEVLFWPIPDAVWIMVYHYQVLTGFLRTATPYALVGADHAETILACMVAELDRMINSPDAFALSNRTAEEAIARSAAKDKAREPASLGVMPRQSGQDRADASDLGALAMRYTLTINGATPDP